MIVQILRQVIGPLVIGIATAIFGLLAGFMLLVALGGDPFGGRSDQVPLVIGTLVFGAGGMAFLGGLIVGYLTSSRVGLAIFLVPLIGQWLAVGLGEGSVNPPALGLAALVGAAGVVGYELMRRVTVDRRTTAGQDGPAEPADAIDVGG